MIARHAVPHRTHQPQWGRHRFFVVCRATGRQLETTVFTIGVSGGVSGEAALCEHLPSSPVPASLVWQGDITVLRDEGAIQFDGKEFRALEPLFPHLPRERYTDLNWL